MYNKKKRARKYCAVFKCLNTDREPDLTFFKLPQDDERCRTWLKLIDRQELLKQDFKKSSYYVCSKHFSDSSFKIIKQLKDDALPSISLHNQPQEGSPCSQQPSTSSEVKSKAKILSNKIEKNSSKVKFTPEDIKSKSQMSILPAESKEYAIVGTQTDTNLQSSEEQTQTPHSLTAQMPRKRKLSNKLQDCKLKRRRLDQEPTKIKKKLGAKNLSLTCNDPDS
ncbi:52 kDa repressor of the inhibitor of the protein kinase-like [Aricia agestis]|uniref:52 kDa repressor of the inhibitor of the protein kinase-like n=1 Tax=Aricia agestis TaxID=91739 RepID=UPI001C203DCB|nr:52 kDa repressor of the inhibitor of the protein kinase-like [Aricia agestis]